MRPGLCTSAVLRPAVFWRRSHSLKGPRISNKNRFVRILEFRDKYFNRFGQVEAVDGSITLFPQATRFLARARARYAEEAFRSSRAVRRDRLVQEAVQIFARLSAKWKYCVADFSSRSSTPFTDGMPKSLAAPAPRRQAIFFRWQGNTLIAGISPSLI